MLLLLLLLLFMHIHRLIFENIWLCRRTSEDKIDPLMIRIIVLYITLLLVDFLLAIDFYLGKLLTASILTKKDLIKSVSIYFLVFFFFFFSLNTRIIIKISFNETSLSRLRLKANKDIGEMCFFSINCSFMIRLLPIVLSL